MQNKTTKVYGTPIQLKLPVDLERIIKINDPVYSFSEVMAHIDLQKYFVEQKGHETGRPRHDGEKLLKIVLFAFMEHGYCSVRQIQRLCETDIRFMWLLDEHDAPSHAKIGDFIKKYMKFTMYEKESKDSKYREYPYRACNFDIDHEGFMVCPNGKRFHFLQSAPVKGNNFGRTEEYYRCKDCTGCPHSEKCHKSKDNRVVRINRELTQFHNGILANLNRVHRALLRINRSIQAEGTFGEVKWNRG